MPALTSPPPPRGSNVTASTPSVAPTTTARPHPDHALATRCELVGRPTMTDRIEGATRRSASTTGRPPTGEGSAIPDELHQHDRVVVLRVARRVHDRDRSLLRPAAER